MLRQIYHDFKFFNSSFLSILFDPKFQVITALGKIWHLEHFCCQSCREELGTRSFFERDEMPFCEPCYHQLFAPTCEKCQEPILDVGSSYKLGPLVLFCEFIWMLKIAYLCQLSSPFFISNRLCKKYVNECKSNLDTIVRLTCIYCVYYFSFLHSRPDMICQWNIDIALQTKVTANFFTRGYRYMYMYIDSES